MVGGINAKVDLALLAEVAVRRPDWRIELVGPLSYGLDADELACLRALPNVQFAGAVPPEKVPAVMAGCDVGLIPYKRNEQTRHVNPLKVYEYLACGKPVVGTPLPELAQFEPLVRLAGNVDGFVEAVEAALAEGDAPQAVAARLAVEAANTWDARVERMVALVERPPGKLLFTPAGFGRGVGRSRANVTRLLQSSGLHGVSASAWGIRAVRRSRANIWPTNQL